MLEENKTVELKEEKLGKVNGGSFSKSNMIVVVAGYYYNQYSKDIIYYLPVTKTGYKDEEVVVKVYEKQNGSYSYSSDFYITLENLHKCEKAQIESLSF